MGFGGVQFKRVGRGAACGSCSLGRVVSGTTSVVLNVVPVSPATGGVISVLVIDAVCHVGGCSVLVVWLEVVLAPSLMFELARCFDKVGSYLCSPPRCLLVCLHVCLPR